MNNSVSLTRVHLFLFSVLSVLFFGCPSDSETDGEKDGDDSIFSQRSDLESSGYQGNIKKITTETYEALNSFGEIDKGQCLWTYNYRYNEYGNLTNQELYRCNGDLFQSSVWEYNDDQNVVLYVKANENGDLMSKVLTNWEDDLNYEKLEFDSLGQLDRKVFFSGSTDSPVKQDREHYDAEGNLIARYKNDLNEYGDVLYTEGYIFVGSESFPVTYSYERDANSKILEQKATCIDSPNFSTTQSRYNSSSHLISQTEYDCDGAIVSSVSHEYFYDEAGNIFKKISSENGQAKYVTEYSYTFY